MKQKRRRRLFRRASGGEQFESLKVGDLAARMSELRRLRERVKRAEAQSRVVDDETPIERHSN
jgi:hypothetical protein